MTAPRHIARYSPDNTAPDADGRDGPVLEIGSGAGQHIAHWAGEFSGLRWVPSNNLVVAFARLTR